MNKLLVAVGVVILLNIGIFGFVYAAYINVVPTPQFLRGIFLDKKTNSVYEQYCSEKKTMEPIAFVMQEQALGASESYIKNNLEALYESKDIERINLMLLMVSAAYNYVAPKDLQDFKDAWTYITTDLQAKSEKIQAERYQFIQDTSKQDTKILLDNLLQSKYPEWEVPLVLRIVAQGITQERSFDLGFKLHTCNAEKYYDPFSMYYLARVYASGDREIKGASPDLVVRKFIEKNMSEAYFWFSVMRDSSALHAENAAEPESMGAFRNSLEGALSKKERDIIDQSRASAFISARYPQYRELSALVNSLLR